MKGKNLIFLTLIFIFVISFFFRLYGIARNDPFWVDEFGTAIQARYVLKYGLSAFNNSNVNFEPHNITTHFLVALFFKLFGQKEWIARLPFVIIGSLVPVVVFFLTKYLSDIKTALSAAILTTFSYLEILWSRQARGYVLQQLLILTAFYLYLKIINDRKKSTFDFCLLTFTLLLGLLTHTMFLIAVISIVVHLILTNRKLVLLILSQLWFYLSFFLLLFIMYKVNFLANVLSFFTNPLQLSNNFWYYHSFLWREYGLVSFLGFFGLILAYFKKKQPVSLIILFIIFQLIFVNFIFSPYHSRYLLPILSFLFIGMAFSISSLAQPIFPRLKFIIPLLITLAIIFNGNKFVFKPKKYYSLNHDFREVANIDYHQIYDLITKKTKKEKKVAIIETWPARTYWYFNNINYEPLYHFRWQDEEGLALGMAKKTSFQYNSSGEKIMAKNLGFVGELSDLLKVIKKYPKGFIFIDDSSLPKEIISYSEKNFKKELYLDHYPLDDNPYSIWPATLYSWGIK